MLERLENYLETLKLDKRLSPKTIALYRSDLQILESFERSVERARSHLSQCAPSTHARKLIVWKKYLRAIGEDYLRGLEAPKVRRQPPEFLTDAEIQKFQFQCLALDEEDRIFVEIALTCGLRLAEILQIKDPVIEDGWIKITRKGGREQMIPLSESLSEKLIGFSGFRKSRRYFQNLIPKLAKKAGIRKRITPHKLRHTFASRALRRGCDLATLRDMLGHHSVSVTNIYCHSTPQQLMKLVRENE